MTPTTLLSFDVAERRVAAAAALAPLADALENELAPWLDRALPIPAHKARLTKIGGWCPLDGAMLTFEPSQPHDHRCPLCGTVQRGEEHDQYWAMGAQLWTAERAAQAAALYVVRGHATYQRFALRVLSVLAEYYEQWPNRDNVLGPSRPFFSTYLESIWLLNLCHAMALLESVPLPPDATRTLGIVRDKLVQPSASLIATFHEGLSNRQVWNEVALLSAHRVLGDTRALSRRLGRADGLFGLVGRGLLADGTWYEGENYHLFAHRGLWYGRELLRTLGHTLAPALERKFVHGFAAPFLGLLPDDTFPSRRDSKYAVSIRQWRFAEWCELGVLQARASDQYTSHRVVLAGVLSRLYDNSVPRGDTGRARSTADAERSEPPAALSRADLSWRALLSLDAAIIPREAWRPLSVCLPDQGLAIMRREQGRLYVALEGGHTGGGHGHPDRLALTMQHDHTRYLEDPGTGSYVSRTLHWYRSSIAHAAPLFDGASQRPVPATLVAYDEQPDAGWIVKRVDGLADGVTVQRSVIVCDGYLVDVVEWHASTPRTLDLQIARAAITNTVAWQPAEAHGAGALEDGFDFLRDVECASAMIDVVQLTVPGHAPHDAVTGDTAHAWYTASVPASLWRANAPGPPECADRPLHWLHAAGDNGRMLGVWCWNDSVQNVAFDVTAITGIVTMNDGTVARHARTTDAWCIDITTPEAARRIELRLNTGSSTMPVLETHDVRPGDFRRAWPMLDAPALSMATVEANSGLPGSTLAGAAKLRLSKTHYLQTELSWHDAGRPTARLQFGTTPDALIIDIVANTGTPQVPEPDAINPLDNERADVNADGIQVYLGTSRAAPWSAAWLVVPDARSTPIPRITPLMPASPPISAQWTITARGWAMRLMIARAALPLDADGAFAFDLVVNERGEGRERRRGQLVLSGGGGFAYLRGDRHEPSHALHLRLV